MRTDAAFRAAFAESPDDPGLRLRYADWLDEFDRRDLATAVRLDVELAGLKPWDDRYPDLRAERDRRHAGGGPFSAGWLADRAPLVADVPPDTVCRWQAARAFVGRWCGEAGLLGPRPDSPVELHDGNPADALSVVLDHRPGACHAAALGENDLLPLVAGLRARLPGYGRLVGLDVFEGPGVAVVVKRPAPVGRVWVFGRPAAVAR
jgi:uncharacterized protein (TIGR02996 family)